MKKTDETIGLILQKIEQLDDKLQSLKVDINNINNIFRRIELNYDTTDNRLGDNVNTATRLSALYKVCMQFFNQECVPCWDVHKPFDRSPVYTACDEFVDSLKRWLIDINDSELCVNRVLLPKITPRTIGQTKVFNAVSRYSPRHRKTVRVYPGFYIKDKYRTHLL